MSDNGTLIVGYENGARQLPIVWDNLQAAQVLPGPPVGTHLVGVNDSGTIAGNGGAPLVW